MSVVQLIPGRSRGEGGVSAYAQALGAALSEHLGLGASLVSLGEAAENGAGAAGRGAAERRSPADRLDALADAGGPSRVVLHYSNYGFEARGCPTWLAPGLLRLKARGRETRLVTFFHEVYATGPPWRSSFWLSPVQRSIARRIAEASDALATSLPLYADLLGRWVERERVPVLPVFSTVGEPSSPPAFEARAPSLVVFGTPGLRQRAYGELRPALERACRALGCEEIWDIGPPSELPGVRLGPSRIEALGLLPPREVSARLAEARAGFLAYPAAFLPKSSVFAAYAAHGLLPVTAWRRDRRSGPLRDGEQFLTVDRLETDRPACAEVARAAHAWYGRHSLARQVEAFARLLGLPAAGR